MAAELFSLCNSQVEHFIEQSWPRVTEMVIPEQNLLGVLHMLKRYGYETSRRLGDGLMHDGAGETICTADVRIIHSIEKVAFMKQREE